MDTLTDLFQPLPNWMFGSSVKARNALQNSGRVHPYTCGGANCRKTLLAVEGGWTCTCGYTQPLNIELCALPFQLPETLFQHTYLNVDAALNAAKNNGRSTAVFIVGGEWCKWCVKLKETLTKDNRLIQAIAEDSLQLAWVTVNKKTVDQSGIRERFNVKSVPYLLLLNPEGATIEATEFIGDEDVNINEYLRWLRSHNDDAL